MTAGFRRARSIAVLKAAAETYGWDPRPSPKPRGNGEDSDRTRHRVLVPRADHGGADRRSRSESQDRSRLGEADRVRPRLRPGGQSRKPASHRRVRHAARPEPRPSRGGPVRHRKGDQPSTGPRIRLSATPTFRNASMSCWSTAIRIRTARTCRLTEPVRPRSNRCMAAIANAIYDATGVRIRRVPFRDDRVLAALKAAGA